MANTDCAKAFKDGIQAARSAYLNCIAQGTVNPTRCVELYWAAARAALDILIQCIKAGGNTNGLTEEELCYITLAIALADAIDAFNACIQAGTMRWKWCEDRFKEASQSAYDAWRKCLKDLNLRPPAVPADMINRPELYPPILSPVDITLPRPGVKPPLLSSLVRPQTVGVSVLYPLDSILNGLLNQLGTSGQSLAGTHR